MKRLFELIVVLVLSGTAVLHAQYPTNFEFVQVPDPLSGTNAPYLLVTQALPGLGSPFFDTHFGTMLIRTTDADYIHGRHEYSRFDPFNQDQSMIILDPDALWNVYSTASFPYNKPGNLIRTINLEEPRWDLVDKDVIWGTEEFSIKQVNVSTGQVTVIKDFSLDPVTGPLLSQGNVYRITMMDEGESSLDRRYWAFYIQGNDQAQYEHLHIFTWDRITDSILGVYTLTANEKKLDWIGMSPLGNWVLIGGDYDNGGNLAGLTMTNRELTQFHRLDYTTAHSDVGLDCDGNEVIIMQNTMTDHIDLIPIDLLTQPILEAGGSYDNTNRTPLIRLFYSNQSPYGMQSGIHISCNTAGYCIVSTFTEPGLPEQNWLDRSIIIVRLDEKNPEAYYLAKLYTTAGSYWEETQATISNDGSKIVWASNWNQNVGNEQVFLMQLNMPSNWETLITTVPVRGETKENQFQLQQNYPNPFNPDTSIRYALEEASHVIVKIFNIAGETIKTLKDTYEMKGLHSVRWDGNNDRGKSVSGGVYFCSLQADDYKDIIRMVYIK